MCKGCRILNMVQVRDNYWLMVRLNELWEKYFSDVARENPIMIKFGRYSRLRLGSIKLLRHSEMSMITITEMFKDSEIPPEVVDHTIAHELIHYTHGFSSKRQREFRHPHAGGVIRSEMKARNMLHLNNSFRIWVKSYRTKLADERR